MILYHKLNKVHAGVKAFFAVLLRAEPIEQPPKHVPDTIPLDRAVLCCDCLVVTKGKDRCLTCGSDAVASLSIWMNKKVMLFRREVGR